MVQIGLYNVEDAGLVYDNDNDKQYKMFIFQKFNGLEDTAKPIGKRKTLYFRYGKDFLIPRFTLEAQIEKCMKYRNNEKIEVKSTEEWKTVK